MAPARENPFTNAQRQFDIAADMLELESGLRKILRVPQREHRGPITLRTPCPRSVGALAPQPRPKGTRCPRRTKQDVRAAREQDCSDRGER